MRSDCTRLEQDSKREFHSIFGSEKNFTYPWADEIFTEQCRYCHIHDSRTSTCCNFFFVRAETTTRTDADYVPTTDYGTSGTTMVSADHVLVGALARDEEEQK